MKEVIYLSKHRSKSLSEQAGEETGAGWLMRVEESEPHGRAERGHTQG